MKKTDYRRIRDIENTTIEEYIRYLEKAGEEDTATRSLSTSLFRHYLIQRSCFVAEVEGIVIGYILCQPTSCVHNRRRELWLDYIAVVPEFRSKGVGSSLLARVVMLARSHHFELVYAGLNPNNPESAGFASEGGL